MSSQCVVFQHRSCATSGQIQNVKLNSSETGSTYSSEDVASFHISVSVGWCQNRTAAIVRRIKTFDELHSSKFTQYMKWRMLFSRLLVQCVDLNICSVKCKRSERVNNELSIHDLCHADPFQYPTPSSDNCQCNCSSGQVSGGSSESSRI